MEVITTRCFNTTKTTYCTTFNLQEVSDKLSNYKFVGIKIPAYPIPEDYIDEDYHTEDIMDILLESEDLNVCLAYARYNKVLGLYTVFSENIPAIMLNIPDHELHITIVSKTEIKEINWVFMPMEKLDDNLIHHWVTKLNSYTPRDKLSRIEFSKGKKIFNITSEEPNPDYEKPTWESLSKTISELITKL